MAVKLHLKSLPRIKPPLIFVIRTLPRTLGPEVYSRGERPALAMSYQLREAEVTLFRGRRPVLATKLVPTAQVDLLDFAPSAQPGGRIHVFVL